MMIGHKNVRKNKDLRIKDKKNDMKSRDLSKIYCLL